MGLYNNSLEKISDIFMAKNQSGKITVTFPSEKIKTYKGPLSGIEADISLKNYNLFYKLVQRGSLGLAESYMDGDFETRDLSNLLLFAYENQSHYLNQKKKKFVIEYLFKLKKSFSKNTIKNSKKYIKYHYDLGNNFYKHWLDETMTYSSALFKEKNEDLYSAQINKYHEIAKPLKLNENSTLLEIGCGWGGFSTFIAKNYLSKIKAITISKEQYDFTSRKVFHEGLNEKISVEMKDYREINEKFTNIASIEMFEAVGKEYWHTFFDKIKKSLKEDGIASLQIITIDENKVENYQKKYDFIQQYIFPGGVLPSKKQLQDVTSGIGLNLQEFKNYKNSYAKTLNLWNKKFQIAWPIISKEGFSERFKKMWEYYFSYCEAGFISGSTDVSQFILKK